VAATCDGLRVRLICDLLFFRCREDEHGPRGQFAIPAGTICSIVDTPATRAYTDRKKKAGDDLIPVQLAGQVRYVPRSDLEMVRG
jgi:hypothetical protein